MPNNADGYAATLLTIALSPNREEYARPLSNQEYYRLEERVRESNAYRTIGDLFGEDISGLMLRLDVSEEEAYRIFTLLNRDVHLSYAIENFAAKSTGIVSKFDSEYPHRLTARMRKMAPVFYYRTVNAELIRKPAFAIMVICGVKTTAEAREGVETIVKKATELGYAILTGGELGVSRVAANAVLECGGNLIDVLGGGFYEHMQNEMIAELLKQNRCALLSLEHPEAMFTISHAIARNKVIFSLADAAIVINTDNKRGEIDALQNHYCDWIYAWSGSGLNHQLISRGATPVAELRSIDIAALSRHWKASESEQISMFDSL